MTDTTQIATANGTGATPGERTMSRKARRRLADMLRLRARFLTLDNLDKRTSAYRRAQSLISEMTADLGGDSEITCAQRLLIGRAAICAVMTEDQEARFLSGAPVAPEVHATLSNSLKRLLETIGISRVPRDVSPSLSQIAQHIADQETSEQADDVDEADAEAAA